MKKWFGFLLCLPLFLPFAQAEDGPHDCTVVNVPKDASTLQEAYGKVASHGSIYLSPGTYTLDETLEITLPIFISGQGENAEDVVLQGKEKNVLHCRYVQVGIENLMIRNVGRTPEIDSPEIPEFFEPVKESIAQAAAVRLDGPGCRMRNCFITSEKGCGIVMTSPNYDAIVECCTISNCGGVGIWAYPRTCGRFLRCFISENQMTGMIASGERTKMYVIQCRFENGKRGGLFLCGGVWGEVSGDFCGNAEEGLRIHGEGTDPQVTARFLNGKSAGVVVRKGGGGLFQNCEFSGNEAEGLRIQDKKTNPTLKLCRFLNGKSYGAVVSNEGNGIFESCQFEKNASGGLLVKGEGTRPAARVIQFSKEPTFGMCFTENAEADFIGCVFQNGKGPGILVKDAANPTVKGCKLHDVKTCGILIEDGGRGEFDDVEWIQGNGIGIELKGQNTAPTLKGGRFSHWEGRCVRVSEKAGGKFNDCTFSGNTSEEVQVTGCETSPSFFRCRFCKERPAASENEVFYGASVSEGASGVFQECLFQSTYAVGLVIRDVRTHPNILQCRFENGLRVGLRVEKGANGVIKDCTFTQFTATGLEITDAQTNPNVLGSRFYASPGVGICVRNGASGSVAACKFSRNQSAVRVCDPGTSPVFGNLEITGGRQYGIRVENGAAGAFAACIFSQCQEAGVYVSGKDSTPKFEKCTITENRTGARIAQGAEGIFEACTFLKNSTGFEVLDANSNPTLAVCRILNNAHWGVHVGPEAGGAFFGNVLSENGQSEHSDVLFLDGSGNWNVREGKDVVREKNTPNE